MECAALGFSYDFAMTLIYTAGVWAACDKTRTMVPFIGHKKDTVLHFKSSEIYRMKIADMASIKLRMIFF